MIKPKIITFGLLILLFVSGLMVVISVLLMSPTNSEVGNEQTFVIAKNESIAQIASRLYDNHLVRHPLVFRYVVWHKGLDKKIQAGSFKLSSAMTPQEIGEKLTQGVDDVWITIPEGMRVEEIADFLSAQKVLSEFKSADFINGTKELEGYIFPDTYLVPKTVLTTNLISLMQNTFDQKIVQVLKDDLAGSSRSLNEIITMASIIQREAGENPEEMAHVSGILWNRLNAGQVLAVDCTLQYIEGYNPDLKTWWAPPSIVTKQSTSRFNTYRRSGLPPAPIANPGLEAVLASLKPQETTDFYYLHDSQGQIHYAQNLSQHNANIQKFLK